MKDTTQKNEKQSEELHTKPTYGRSLRLRSHTIEFFGIPLCSRVNSAGRYNLDSLKT